MVKLNKINKYIPKPNRKIEGESEMLFCHLKAVVFQQFISPYSLGYVSPNRDKVQNPMNCFTVSGGKIEIHCWALVQGSSPANRRILELNHPKQQLL